MLIQILAFVFVSAVALNEQSQPRTQHPAEPAQEQKALGANRPDSTGAAYVHPLALRFTPAFQGAHLQARDEQDAGAEHRYESTEDWWFGVFPNIAIAGFTLILTVVSVYQGYMLWASTGTTEKAANAALMSATAARDALMLNRPFLDLVPTTIIEVTHGDVIGLQAEFNVHNFGQTAARLDAIEGSANYWKDQPNSRAFDEHPGAMIAPGADYTLRCYAGELSGQSKEDFQSRRLVVVKVAGHLRYTDQFANVHVKNFGWWCQHTQTKPPYFHMEGNNSERDWGWKASPDTIEEAVRRGTRADDQGLSAN